MKNRIWTTRIVATLAVCTLGALAATSFAAPQDDHKDRHAQDQRGKQDRNVRDKRQDKHADHTDKGKSPKDHGKHDNGRHHKDQVKGRGNGNAALGYLQTSARIREQRRRDALRHRHGHDRVVYVGSHGNDDWKQIAAIAGLVAVIGLIEHDNTLVFVGAAGALYSLDRYNHDRHSHNRADRLRALYFSKPYFYRNGHRYHRILVTSHRKRYYRFVRG